MTADKTTVLARLADVESTTICREGALKYTKFLLIGIDIYGSQNCANSECFLAIGVGNIAGI